MSSKINHKKAEIQNKIANPNKEETSENECYNPQWEKLGNMNFARHNHSMCYWDGSHKFHSNNTNINSPQQNMNTILKSQSPPQNLQILSSLNGSILQTPDSRRNSLQLRSRNDSLIQNHHICENDMLFVIGGSDNKVGKTFECYKFNDQKWITLSNCGNLRENCGIMPWYERHKIMIAGGWNAPLSIEEYDIHTNKWIHLPKFNDDHTIQPAMIVYKDTFLAPNGSNHIFFFLALGKTSLKKMLCDLKKHDIY